MDCIVLGLAKSRTRLSLFHFHLQVLTLTFTDKEKETQGADTARLAHSFIRYYLTIKGTCQASPDSDNE